MSSYYQDNFYSNENTINYNNISIPEYTPDQQITNQNNYLNTITYTSPSNQYINQTLPYLTEIQNSFYTPQSTNKYNINYNYQNYPIKKEYQTSTAYNYRKGIQKIVSSPIKRYFTKTSTYNNQQIKNQRFNTIDTIQRTNTLVQRPKRNILNNLNNDINFNYKRNYSNDYRFSDAIKYENQQMNNIKVVSKGNDQQELYNNVLQLDGQVNTVKSLIRKADGLRGDAFMNRAVLNREKDNFDHEIIAVDLAGIMNGTQPDIPLMKNDVLYIPSIQNLKERQTVTIHGQVASAGTFDYAENMTIEDLVVMAGGLLEDAATVKVDVTRRIKDPNSSTYSKEVGKTFTVDLSNSFKVGKESFVLEPFDQVYIRKSPSYQEQQNVTISGEILFGGTYSLQNKTERISSLIERAGGLTPEAYAKGARLTRTRTLEEAKREQDLLNLAKRTTEEDSIEVASLELSTTYSVGLDLEKAIKNPNSDYDLVMKDGDILFIPEYINTIKITGAVMYPNTVLFEKDKDLSYYINQAGGFNNNARKRKVFVVNLNGKASKLSLHSKQAIEPGSEIVVPTKEKKDRSTMAEIMTMASLSASLAAVVASIVRLVK